MDMAQMLLGYLAQEWTTPDQLSFIDTPTPKNDWLWNLEAQAFEGKIQFQGSIFNFRLGKNTNGQWERELWA